MIRLAPPRLDLPWSALQLADAALPAGSLAHSAGLEAAWQLGRVDDPREHLAALLLAAASGSLPIVAAVCAEPSLFAEADRLWDAVVVHPVPDRASRAQGRALLRAAAHALDDAALRHRLGELRRAGAPIHHPPVAGLVAHAAGLGPRTAIELQVYVIARDQASAAIRLGILGPLAGQELLHRARAWAARAVDLALDRDWRDPATAHPLLDLWQGQHDRLYSRLFQS